MLENLTGDDALDLIQRPHIHNFLESAQIEAAHQTARWGEDHDLGKPPEDWLWVVGYLTTKATQAARYGDHDKYLHHIVTTAAACANWHRCAAQRAEPDQTNEVVRRRVRRSRLGAGGEPLTKNEWISQCADVFERRAMLLRHNAIEMAEACFENADDPNFSPESAAEEEISCWTDD